MLGVMSDVQSNKYEQLLKRLEDAIALVEVDDPYTDKVPLGENKSSYGDMTCGCSWDSGPYPTHCGEHDPMKHLREVVAEFVNETGRAERAEALIAELLDNFDPYISAFERAGPNGDGEELARRMREAIGRRDEA